MRRITIALVVLGIAALTTMADAARRRARPNPARTEVNAGIVYGEGHAFFLDAPRGWVLDRQAGAKDGLPVVLYPRGSSWSKASAVLRVSTAPRDTADRESLESFIAGDVEKARADSPSLHVASAPPLMTGDGKHAEVRVFTGDSTGTREEVAYVAERRVFVRLALTSKTPEAFVRSTPAFEALVRSYTFFTENLLIK